MTMIGVFCIKRKALPNVTKDTLVNMDNEAKVRFIKENKELIGQYKINSYFWLLNSRNLNTRDYLWFSADVDELEGWFT